MNVKGLAKEWDENEVVRERIRDGGDLIHPESGEGEDIKTVVLNQEVVGPMVVRMSASHKKPHPPIEDLTAEVETIYKVSKRHPLPAWTDLRKLAWRLRYMVCFVKTKARRSEPSTEPRMQVHWSVQCMYTLCTRV